MLLCSELPSRKRDYFHGRTVRLAALLAAVVFSLGCGATVDEPNIIYILVDDMGYGEVGAYGQSLIQTPNIDRLADSGMRFTQHYAGSALCASSRGALMTGQHSGHGAIRDNYELGGWLPWSQEGQLPLPDAEVTLGEMIRPEGYVTAFIGKWGLGGPGSEGVPWQQGFDYFFGYLGQRIAHNHYSTHLWRNWQKIVLQGNPWLFTHQHFEEPLPTDQDYYDRFIGAQYAPDLILDDALDFITAHRNRRFFLTYATSLPHAALQVPLDSLAQYQGLWDVGPYLGDRLYLPHPHPRAAYAAMITRMDQGIGQIIDLIESLDLTERTLIIFASDNGPSSVGGVEPEFFDSTAGLRADKGWLYEGGIRVPMIASWPGQIAPATTTDHVSAMWDVMPTLAELTGAALPPDTDGISFLPTLLGQDQDQLEHESLYWELHTGSSGTQAVRKGDWKAVRRNIRVDPSPPVELYDLATDVGETTDVSAGNPVVVQELFDLMQTSRTPSALPEWNFPPEY